MLFIAIRVIDSIRLNISISRVVGYVLLKCFQDSSIVFFDLLIRLVFIRRRKVVLDGHHTTDVLEEFRGESSAFAKDMYCRKTLVEYKRIQKVLRNFGGGDAFHWYQISSLGKPVRNFERIFILPRRADESADDIDAHCSLTGNN